MHHVGGFAPEIVEHLRQRLDPLLGKDPDHLALDAGRVRQRTEQVEDRARAELDARRPHMLHRGMMRGREHEADAGAGDAAADVIGGNIDAHAERGEHVGGAGARREGAVAVLRHRHAAARDDQGRAGRDVVGAGGVAAGADHVDRVRRRLDAQHLRAHRGDGAGDLVDRLAAHAQRHQEAAHLRRGGFARHHEVERGGGLLAGQYRAGRDLSDERPELHAPLNAPRARARAWVWAPAARIAARSRYSRRRRDRGSS